MKNNSPAPDYAPLAAATKDATATMKELGNRQLDFAEKQYAELSPIMRGIADSQIAAQQEQLAQARDYYDYQKSTFRPVEQQIVADAQNFNTAAYRDQIASQAAADAALAFGKTQSASQRAMASMGVNPNSGRFAGLSAANNLGLAAQRSAAMTGSRTQAEQMGYARQLDAAGLGRNLPGLSLSAYGGASSAGSAAGQGLYAAGNNYMAGIGAGAATVGSGHSMNIQGQSAILNTQAGVYNNSNDSILGDIGGLLGGISGVMPLFSDRRLKENIKAVGVDAKTGLTLYEFEYKRNPGRVFVGVMADEVEKQFPQEVGEYDGFKYVDYGAIGVRMKEVVNGEAI